MSTEENKAIVRRVLEELDRGNHSILTELCTADARLYATGTAEPVSVSGLGPFVEAYFTAFPDYTHRIEDMIAEADRIAVRMVLSGTHKGEFMGLSPTGRRVEYGEILICHFAEGKIADMWVQEDNLWMMRQLGMELRPKEQST